MAITENTFTDAEFIAAIDANPALAAVIKTALGTKEYVVQDKTEHQSFLQNFKDTEYKKKVIDEHTSEFAPKLEKDIKDATGIDKVDANEKYYDYFKRAVTTKLGTVKQMETELEGLKKAGGVQSEADKIRIQQLEAGIATKETEWSDKYKAKETELNNVKSGAVVENAFAAIRPKYKAGLPESLVKLSEKTIFDATLPNVRFNEEKKVFYVVDAKGEPIIDKATFLPKTVDAVIAEQLADIVDPGKKAAGSGTGADDFAGAEGGKGEFKGVPPTVKTKVQLTEYLQHLGIMAGSGEFTKIFDEHSKSLPLR